MYWGKKLGGGGVGGTEAMVSLVFGLTYNQPLIREVVQKYPYGTPFYCKSELSGNSADKIASQIAEHNEGVSLNY
jgi:hypothetical protein